MSNAATTVTVTETITSAQTAKVSVYDACDCYSCARNDRWFMCQKIGHRFIAEYMCEPICAEGSPSVPHPANVAAISKLHPGTVLVYID